MSEVLAAIDETSPSPDEDNSRMEQLMISMLEVSDNLYVHCMCVCIYYYFRREKSC